MFFKTHSAANPDRSDGENFRADGHPVLLARSVGIPAWVLPHINILDTLGLNDFIVARGPAVRRPGHPREMAHERYAHPAYVAAFRPNVTIGKGATVQISKREQPLTAGDIQRAEREWAKSGSDAQRGRDRADAPGRSR